MISYFKSLHISFKLTAIALAIAIFITSFTYYICEHPSTSYAQIIDCPLQNALPTIKPSLAKTPYQLPLMKGLEFDASKPLQLQFYFDTMSKKKIDLKETNRLIKYFLGFLAVPEEKLWVNLSPYEKDRIIPDCLSRLDIGKNLLLEDYILKQLTASLTDPKTKTGKDFWKEVYAAANRVNPGKKIPLGTMYKVWIMPESAEVYEYTGFGDRSSEKGNKQKHTIAFVKEARLKVMMEEDLTAMQNVGAGSKPAQKNGRGTNPPLQKQSIEIFKHQLLPIIKKQVNESENFAPLRQLYYALILATYFKQKLKNHFLFDQYIDSEKTNTLNLQENRIKEKVYTSYLRIFQKGIYNQLKTEYDPSLHRKIKRRYFSGGAKFNTIKSQTTVKSFPLPEKLSKETKETKNRAKKDLQKATINVGLDEPTATQQDTISPKKLSRRDFFRHTFSPFQKAINTLQEEEKETPPSLTDTKNDATNKERKNTTIKSSFNERLSRRQFLSRLLQWGTGIASASFLTFNETFIQRLYNKCVTPRVLVFEHEGNGYYQAYEVAISEKGRAPQKDGLFTILQRNNSSLKNLVGQGNEAVFQDGKAQCFITKIPGRIIQNIPAQDRQQWIITLGDIHGEYNEIRQLMADLGLTNSHPNTLNDEWILTNTKLIQMGDLIHGGPDSKKVCQYLLQLQNSAKQQTKSEVILLLGNADAYIAFQTMIGSLKEAIKSEAIDEKLVYDQELAELLLNAVEQQNILGTYSLGNCLFAHGLIGKSYIQQIVNDDITQKQFPHLAQAARENPEDPTVLSRLINELLRWESQKERERKQQRIQTITPYSSNPIFKVNHGGFPGTIGTEIDSSQFIPPCEKSWWQIMGHSPVFMVQGGNWLIKSIVNGFVGKERKNVFVPTTFSNGFTAVTVDRGAGKFQISPFRFATKAAAIKFDNVTGSWRGHWFLSKKWLYLTFCWLFFGIGWWAANKTIIKVISLAQTKITSLLHQGITVKPAQPKDAAAIAELYENTHEFDELNYPSLGKKYYQKVINASLKKDVSNEFFLVAQHRGKTIGYIKMVNFANGTTVEIRDLSIDPSFKGNKAKTYLLETGLQRLKKVLSIQQIVISEYVKQSLENTSVLQDLGFKNDMLNISHSWVNQFLYKQIGPLHTIIIHTSAKVISFSGKILSGSLHYGAIQVNKLLLLYKTIWPYIPAFAKAMLAIYSWTYAIIAKESALLYDGIFSSVKNTHNLLLSKKEKIKIMQFLEKNDSLNKGSDKQQVLKILDAIKIYSDKRKRARKLQLTIIQTILLTRRHPSGNEITPVDANYPNRYIFQMLRSQGFNPKKIGDEFPFISIKSLPGGLSRYVVHIALGEQSAKNTKLNDKTSFTASIDLLENSIITGNLLQKARSFAVILRKLVFPVRRGVHKEALVMNALNKKLKALSSDQYPIQKLYGYIANTNHPKSHKKGSGVILKEFIPGIDLKNTVELFKDTAYPQENKEELIPVLCKALGQTMGTILSTTDGSFNDDLLANFVLSIDPMHPENSPTPTIKNIDLEGGIVHDQGEKCFRVLFNLYFFLSDTPYGERIKTAGIPAYITGFLTTYAATQNLSLNQAKQKMVQIILPRVIEQYRKQYKNQKSQRDNDIAKSYISFLQLMITKIQQPSPDAAESSVEHPQRNEQLKEVIRRENTYRVSNNAGKNVAVVEEFDENYGTDNPMTTKPKTKYTGPNADQIAIALDRIRSPAGALAAFITEWQQGKHPDFTVSELTKALNATRAPDQQLTEQQVIEQLIARAQTTDILIVKNRFTLHENGPYAHTRRGVTKENDTAIWLGEKLFTQTALTGLNDTDIAMLILEEAKHILAPKLNHDVIIHSQALLNKLKSAAQKCGETVTNQFCEADMSNKEKTPGAKQPSADKNPEGGITLENLPLTIKGNAQTKLTHGNNNPASNHIGLKYTLISLEPTKNILSALNIP